MAKRASPQAKLMSPTFALSLAFSGLNPPVVVCEGLAAPIPSTVVYSTPSPDCFRRYIAHNKERCDTVSNVWTGARLHAMHLDVSLWTISNTVIRYYLRYVGPLQQSGMLRGRHGKR